MGTQATEFMVSGQWSAPAPLDKYLATLSVRNTSNDLSNFNVLLNANFGSTKITIEVEDTIMEVNCALSQAEIRLYNGNCLLDFGPGYSEARNQNHSNLEQSLAISTEVAAAIAADGQVDPKAITATLKTTAIAKKKREASATLHSSRKIAPFSHIQIDTVSVTGDPLNPYLSGSEVVEYQGWQGQPKEPTKRVGIGAAILVREEWIHFSDVSLKRPGRLGSTFASIFRTAKSKKSEQFQVLLAYLTRKALQDPKEQKYATLACSAFVLEPIRETVEALSFGPEQEKLILHPALIEQFANLPSGTHEDFVAKVIEKEADPTQLFSDPNLQSDTKISAPRGTVFEALKALNQLSDLPGDFDFSAGYLQENFARSTLQDLSNLGLIKASKGRLLDTIRRFGSSPNDALLYSATQTRWFVFAAAFIEAESIRVPSLKVGRAVSDKFDLGWGPSSQKRYGQNIKKWVAVLDPLFANLDRDHRDFFHVRSLTTESSGKGANPIIDEDFVQEIEFRKLCGQPYAETIKHYNVSMGAYTNWRSRYPRRAAEAVRQASKRFELSQKGSSQGQL